MANAQYIKIRNKLLLIGFLSLLALFAAGDILIDFSEGKSLSHIFSEALLLIFLFGCAMSFAIVFWRNQKNSIDKRSLKPLFFLLVSTAGMIILTYDDIYSVITGTIETSEYLGSIALSHNLHQVVPGKFYRAGQMSHEELRKVLKEYHIKTTIDLRFGNDDLDSSGRTEADVARELSVHYEHIRLLSSKLPPLESVEALLDVYDRAELPILVHCSGGTHRTGFASALWLIEKEGKNKNEAATQLTPRFGFFRWERKIKSIVKGKPTLDSLFWRFLDDENSGPSFRAWVRRQLGEEKAPLQAVN